MHKLYFPNVDKCLGVEVILLLFFFFRILAAGCPTINPRLKVFSLSILCYNSNMFDRIPFTTFILAW